MIADIYLTKGINNYITNTDQSLNEFETAIKASKQYAYPKIITIKLFNSLNGNNLKNKEYIAKKLQVYTNEVGKITNKNFEYNELSMNIAGNNHNLKQVNTHLEKAINQAPNLPSIYTTAGNIFYKQKDCKLAIKYYKKLESLVPERYTKHQGNCRNIKKCRLFRKNAARFIRAMSNMKKCKYKQSNK